MHIYQHALEASIAIGAERVANSRASKDDYQLSAMMLFLRWGVKYCSGTSVRACHMCRGGMGVCVSLSELACSL